MIDLINKSKGQIMNIDNVSELLKDKLEENYSSEVAVAVKNNLRDHDKLDFFREGDCMNGQKYHYCVGNWLAKKGLYDNCIEAKEKIGLLSWQRYEDDWED